MNIYKYTNIYIYTQTLIHMHKHMCGHTYIYTFRYVHIHAHVHTYRGNERMHKNTTVNVLSFGRFDAEIFIIWLPGTVNAVTQ